MIYATGTRGYQDSPATLGMTWQGGYLSWWTFTAPKLALRSIQPDWLPVPGRLPGVVDRISFQATGKVRYGPGLPASSFPSQRIGATMFR